MNEQQYADALTQARADARAVMEKFLTEHAGNDKRRRAELLALLAQYEGGGQPAGPPSARPPGGAY